MVRTAQEVANTLQEIYEESFGSDECEKYRLSWADLRGVAGVGKLEEAFVTEISERMAESDFALIPLANFILVGYERDFAHARKLPARLLERHLPGDGEAGNDDVDEEETVDE